jgi:hypothetical protein
MQLFICCAVHMKPHDKRCRSHIALAAVYASAPCRKKALAEAELHEPCCGLLLHAEHPVRCKATAFPLTRRVYNSADQTLEAQHPALACNAKRQNGFSHALLLLPLPSSLSKLHERSCRAVANLRM